MGMGVVVGNLAFLEDDKHAQPEVIYHSNTKRNKLKRHKDKLCMARVI